MAKVLSGNTIQLDNGQTIQANNGGWYDAQQFFNGTLSDPGVISSQSDQVGAGQAVSADVIAKTNPDNLTYVNQKRQNMGLSAVPQASAPSPSSPSNPSGTTPNISSLFNPNGNNGGLNLPSLYSTLTTQAGIPDLQTKADAIQAQIDTLTKQQGDAISNNNENPFLSEANRVGRQSKINTDAQNEIDALTNEKNTILGEITSKTTDINNQVGLATQQYNINDQQKQEALGQFNTLLSSGLLGSLSTSDIATISSSTGLPTSVIQEAVTKSQAADVNIQMVTTDHGVTLIDANTGNIIRDVTIPGVTGGSTTPKDTTTTQNEAVGQVINDYLSNKDRQAQISPEDLVRELLLQYPNAETYINNNWTPQQIRAVLGN